MKLGKLEQITDLRSVWKHEAKRFYSLACKKKRIWKFSARL